MRHITQNDLSKQISLPIAQPMTKLAAGESIIVSTVNVALGQCLRYRWCQFQLISARDSGGTLVPNPETVAVKRVPGMGVVFCGVYASSFNSVLQPSGVPVNYLWIDHIGTISSNPFNYFDFPCPDTYSLVMANNTTNLDLEVTLNGAFKMIME